MVSPLIAGKYGVASNVEILPLQLNGELELGGKVVKFAHLRYSRQGAESPSVPEVILHVSDKAKTATPALSEKRSSRPRRKKTD